VKLVKSGNIVSVWDSAKTRYHSTTTATSANQNSTRPPQKTPLDGKYSPFFFFLRVIYSFFFSSKRSYNATGPVDNNSSPSITTNSEEEAANKKRSVKRRKKNDGSPAVALSFTDATVIPDDSGQSDELNGDPILIEALPPPSRRKSPKAPKSPKSPVQEKKSPPEKKPASKKRPHSATPQQAMLDDFSYSYATPYWNYVDGRPLRESSPPAKIKYPSPKMTFTDMNKRAKHIMECISKLQPTEQVVSPKAANTQEEDAFDRPRSLSCSSLSSASTVPLLEESLASPSTPIPYLRQETSLEMLERVSRDLAKFQRKFGTVYQQNEKIK
jgi:hypothetical protein